LVGLFLTASRESGAADELERLTELFRAKLAAAMSRRGCVGHA
jgi:hypothetical protein